LMIVFNDMPLAACGDRSAVENSTGIDGEKRCTGRTAVVAESCTDGAL
jgi:hypothetical protein